MKDKPKTKKKTKDKRKAKVDKMREALLDQCEAVGVNRDELNKRLIFDF